VRNVIVKSVKRHPIDRLLNEDGVQVYKTHEEKNVAMVLTEEKEFRSEEVINFVVEGTLGNDPFRVRVMKYLGIDIREDESRYDAWPMDGKEETWSDAEFEDLIEGVGSDWNYQKIMGKYG